MFSVPQVLVLLIFCFKILLGGQQFPMHPHQLVQATPHSQIIPSVSQSQLSTGLVTSPATMLMQQQGGLSQPQPPGVTYPHMQVMPQTGQNQGELDFRPVGSEEHAYYMYVRSSDSKDSC